MRAVLSKFLVGVVISLSLWANAFAAGIVESASGDVRFAVGQTPAAVAAKGQRIGAGASVTTGANSQAILRFDDGQVVVLSQNTEFKVAEYQFVKDRPQNDKAVFDLLKGALRSITGLIGTRTASAHALRTPTVTIGIRGTDFMVALVNPVYMSVLSGTISATTQAGTVTFGAGSLGVATSTTALAAPIAASALPAAVTSTFSQLAGVAVSAGVGAGAATSAGVGGITPLGVVGAAAAAAAAAAASSNNESPITGTTGTTGTQ